MDFFKDYLQKHKWLFYLWISLDFIIIFLPQWLSSVWSLAEKMLGREIAMQDITWAYFITVPVGLIMFVIAIWAVRSKKTTAVEIAHKSENLTDTLTMMHRRLVELQKEKALHTKVSAKQLEKVLPTLADRMGTVKIKDWPKFRRKFESRIRRAVPPFQHWRYFERPFAFRDFMKRKQAWKEKVYYVALSVAVEVKDELFHTKEWTFEDGIKVSEWVDGYNWGVQALRDNDTTWTELCHSISHYQKDEILRDLIRRHIEFSYIYYNISLMIHYSKKFPKNEFAEILRATLIGSPISPEKAESALAEVLGDVEKRLNEIQEGKPHIRKIIEEILSIKDFQDKTVYILRVLYNDREKLTRGFYSGNATPLDKRAYHQLILHDVVRLEQRKERIYGSDNNQDVGYWILTERGKDVIKYLQENQQILYMEDSQSEKRNKPDEIAAQMVAKTIHDQLDFTQQVIEALGTEQSLVLTPHTWAIGLSGMTGYPREPENAEWLYFGVAVNPISKPIDTLDLLIDNNIIPANNWPRKNVAAFNVYFNVTEWRWKGEKQVELIAHVGNNKHSAGRISIDFDVEHYGHHLI